jgi:serine/threonine protein kinase/WD40 repeat protein
MTGSQPDNEAIFHAARDISNSERRREYVRDACGRDEARIAHVEALLAAADTRDSFLDHPAVSDAVSTSDQPTTGLGTVIGPYKLVEQIGEGGMGTVWMAQQSEPVKRLVALKVIKPGMDSRQVIARFEAERQALALTDHPNIARVLDGGTTDAGRPYFVMDLVRGVPITRYCDEHQLTPKARLELFIPVCQAVQHAHQKGIIHRDLKPSNVLVALYDGQPVPKVIDFGVAKATGQSLTDKTLVSGFGNIVGTLEYMSPEQAEVNQLDIDTRSDIYSLGVLLYELLTGSPPFSRKDLERAGMLEMLRVIREEEPSKPSTKLSTAEDLPTLAANRGTEPAKLTKLVRGELDWIVMKALDKDRNRRYETANGFAMDVQRYLADEAVLACPPSPGYLLRKFVLRNRVAVGVAAFITVTVIGVVGLVIASLNYVNRRSLAAFIRVQEAHGVAITALNRESRARKAEVEARKQSEQVSAHRQIGLASYAWADGDIGLVRKLLAQIPFDLRRWEWHYLNRLTRQHLSAWQFEQQQVCELGFRGDVILAGLMPKATSSPLGRPPRMQKVDLIELRSGNQVTTLENCPYIRLDSDGALLAHPTTGMGSRVLVRSTRTGDVLHSFMPTSRGEHHPLAYAEIYVGGGKIAYRVQSSEPLAVGDLASGKTILEIAERPTRMGIIRDGARLFARLDDKLAYWDLTDPAASPRFVSTPAFSRKWSNSRLAFDPTGHTFATWLHSDASVDLWNAETGAWKVSLGGHPNGVDTASFTPDGSRIATGGGDGIVRVWDCGTGQQLGSYRGLSDFPTHLVWAPDGKSLLSSAQGEVFHWDTERQQEAITVRRHAFQMAFTTNDRVVIKAAQHPLEAIDTATGRLTTLEPPKLPGTMFPLAAGRILFVQSAQGKPRLHLHEYPEGGAGRVLDTPDGSGVSSVALSRDGRRLAVGCTTGVVHVWDAERPTHLYTLGPLNDTITAVQFSANGERLAARTGPTRPPPVLLGPEGKNNLPSLIPNLIPPKLDPNKPPTLVVWEVSGRELFRRQVKHSDRELIAFRPDGAELAVPQPGGVIQIFDTEGGRPERDLPVSRDTICSMTYTRDGSRLITGDSIGLVKIWDSAAGYEIMTLGRHMNAVGHVACSPDGCRLVTAGSDAIRIWDGTPLAAERPRETE